MNRYFLLTLFYTLCLFGLAFILGLGVRKLPDFSQPEVKKEVWIFSGHDVSQSFTPVHNNLNTIYIYLRNISLRNQEPLVFTVKDAAGSVLRTINLTGYNIGDGTNVRFQFAPIADSGGKKYTLNLSSPTSVWANAVGVGFISVDNYSGGEAIVANEAPGDIAFSGYYFPVNHSQVIISTLTGFIAKLARPQFFGYLIFTAGAMWFMISVFFKKAEIS